MRRIRWGPVIAVGAIVALALAAPLLPLSDPLRMDIANRLAPPTLAHPLGQDEYGRDVLTRLLWGARASLLVAFSAAALSCAVGTMLGLAGGFLRGLAEFAALRSMDVLLCFPPLLLALLVVTLLGPGASTLIPVLAVLYLPGFVRVVFAGVLSVRVQEYVEAVRALGAGPVRIMLRTILPNVAGPVLVQFSLAVASAVVLESGLSFLGLGVVPPAASWGLMIGAARATMVQAPLLLLWPCLALILTILAMNALCDALRDAIDPHVARLVARRRGAVEFLAPGLLPTRSSAVLNIRDLTVEIDTPHGPIQPVRGVTLQVDAGEALGIVGESGSGKSLTALSVMGLLPPVARIRSGRIALDGQDVVGSPEPALRRLRGTAAGMVFQDALSSLNPVHTIGSQIVEAIAAHHRIGHGQSRRQAIELLRIVGIPDPARRADAYPHEMSGGMRQRAMIAIAIANRPRLLIADEPTTALDVTIQAQVLELLGSLRRERGMAMVFITHNLPLVSEIADRVAVMYAGEIVEQGPIRTVFSAPLHPYTRALLDSSPDPDGGLPVGIQGTVPAADAMPHGCSFAPRCRHQTPECEAAPVPLIEAAPQRLTRCRRWRELA